MRARTVVLCAVAGVGAALCTWLVLAEDRPQELAGPPGAAPASGVAAVADPWAVSLVPSDAGTDGRLAVTGDEAALAAPIEQRRLEGRVVDGFGQPVAGAAVSLRVRSARPFEAGFGGRRGRFGGGPGARREAAEAAPAAASTDADGRFALHAQAASQAVFEVGVQHRAFAPALVRRPGIVDGDTVRLEEIVLVPGVSARGTVVDEGDRPIPAATVRFRSGPDGGGRGGPGRGWGPGDLQRALEQALDEVVTDAAGAFRIGPLPPGTFVLAADASGYLPGTSTRLEASEGEQLTDLRIRLELGAELSGVVLDREGTPIAGAEVEVERARSGGDEERGGPRRGRGRGLGTAQSRTETDARGRFRFDAVPREGAQLTAQHRRFIDERVDFVDPAKTPVVEIRMERRLGVVGVVVDAATRQPIEHYAIEARRVEGPRRDPGQRGRGRGGDGRGNRAGEGGGMPDERAAWEARMAEREARLVARLGPSGEIPGRTPAPSRHAEGRFAIDDLEPGSYVFDIDAPGYVKVAAGVVELERGQVPAPLTFRLEHGLRISGRVVDARRDPVADARVELLLPEDEQSVPGMPGRGGRGGRGRGPQPSRLASAEVGADGAFALAPQLPGAFRLLVSAPDRPELVHDLVLPADRGIDDLVLSMRSGASVRGHVRDLPSGERATVVFLHTEGERREAEADPSTGGYEIHGLASGGYVVRVEPLGSDPEEGFRQRIGMRLVSESGRPPDLVLAEGADVQYDPELGEAFLGTVAGSVSLNSRPARGLTVRLRPDETVQLPSAGPGERGRRFAERLFSARVDADGAFEIGMVLPGAYALEVESGGGRRGGNGTALHREPVVVSAGGLVERHLFLASGRLRLAVRHAASGEPVARATVALADAGEASGRAPAEWPQLPSYRELRVRDGAIDIEDFGVGSYVFVVRGRDLAETSGRVDVVAGEAAEPLVVRVEASAEGAAPPEGEPGPAPGAPAAARPPNARRGGGR